MLDVLKHRSEFSRALNNFHFEITEKGLLFPKQKKLVNGVFAHRLNGGDLCLEPNTFMYEGLSDILQVYFGGNAQATGFYIAPFTNESAPPQSLTASDFATQMTEFTAYNETARVVWQTDAEANQTMANATNPAVFTINAGPSNIYGAAMIRDTAAKSQTTGKLCAAAQFANPRLNLGNTDKLEIEYTITASDAG